MPVISAPNIGMNGRIAGSDKASSRIRNALKAAFQKAARRQEPSNSAWLGLAQ